MGKNVEMSWNGPVTWNGAADDCDARAESLRQTDRHRYHSSARPLPKLRVGAPVSIQDPSTGLWDRHGTIVGVGRSRDFLIKLPSGRIYWRNRRYLRPFRPLLVPARSALAAPTSGNEPPRPPRSVHFADEGRDCRSSQPPSSPVTSSPPPPSRVNRRSTRLSHRPARLQVDPSLPYYA